MSILLEEGVVQTGHVIAGVSVETAGQLGPVELVEQVGQSIVIVRVVIAKAQLDINEVVIQEDKSTCCWTSDDREVGRDLRTFCRNCRGN
jgi:hypothetical protein